MNKEDIISRFKNSSIFNDSSIEEQKYLLETIDLFYNLGWKDCAKKILEESEKCFK